MRKCIRIAQLNISFSDNTNYQSVLKRKIEKILSLKKGECFEFAIVRRSIDARKKPEIFFSYTVDVSFDEPEKVFKNLPAVAKKKCNLIEPVEHSFPYSGGLIKTDSNRPVVIGAGPCGYFCALFLAKAGLRPIVIEQGKCAKDRKADIDLFWKSKELKPLSNVQFGEGGAGTFSDGKLNTSIKDKSGRIKEVLKTFIQFGAPEDILIDSHPHIGTDKLITVMSNFGEEIRRLGGDIYFNCEVVDFDISNNEIKAVICRDRMIATDTVILACGHSSRKLFRKLFEKKCKITSKNFAVGFRVAHKQKLINDSQYGTKFSEKLEASPYKVTYQAPSGRAIFSFCMCPGGYIVNASSEQGRLCVNGMSYSGRDSEYANSAIIISVTEDDFGADDPLAGIVFQEKLEEKAFNLLGGEIPYDTLGNMRGYDDTCTVNPEMIFKGVASKADLRYFLPHDMTSDFLDAMSYFGKKIQGFNGNDTVVACVESRTSSPIRIERDDLLESNIKGLFPAGEGAGYAGGIVSAGVDGIRVAEAICERKFKSFT